VPWMDHRAFILDEAAHEGRQVGRRGPVAGVRGANERYRDSTSTSLAEDD
jgi:hypothetical protein